MSDDLVLEHLRAIRADLADVELDIRDVEHRSTTLEIAMAHMTATEASHHASRSSRMDRLEDRTERVQRRPEIVS